MFDTFLTEFIHQDLILDLSGLIANYLIIS
jgi:hypothetical protein